jgi:hypothetical protein
MRATLILRWIINALSGVLALLGALLVGWTSIEVVYLATGRVQPDFDQPPMAVVVASLVFGLILLFGGWWLHRWAKKSTPFHGHRR